MKKEFKELDLNQGPLDYQTDALEGMTMGTSHNVKQYLRNISTFITLKSCQGRVMLDRWVSWWKNRANLLCRNLRDYNDATLQIWVCTNIWDKSADVSITDTPLPLASATISILVSPPPWRSLWTAPSLKYIFIQ